MRDWLCSSVYDCSLRQALLSQGLTSTVFQPGRGDVDDIDLELLAAAVAVGEIAAPTAIDMDEGDLYFFKADSVHVHQVPRFEGANFD